jgi:DNA-directed RNA polymerase specialized sigma24 family protein
MTRDQYGKAYEVGFPKTKRYLMARGASWDHAEEVAQQAWVRGWERLWQLHDDYRVQGWTNAAALNLLRSIQRGIRLVPLSECGEPEKELDSDAAIDMARVLAESSSRDRQLFSEVLQGFCTHELARERNVTNAAMLTRICRARRRLAKRFGVNSVATENSSVKRPSNREQAPPEKRQLGGELPHSPTAP